MDFARRQLEKYGWRDGKGLGRHENGISQALKPKLKRGVTGIGHDIAADLTDQWWSQLYNKAAKNVEVEEKNGKTKKIKTKDDKFKITNSTYHLSKKDDPGNKNEQYSDFFIKTAVLTNGGTKVKKVRISESDVDDVKKDVFRMTDEQLFAACEGRTAHKGARHGLKATGKLARIERQEQILLAQPKYMGYSHMKKQMKDKKMAADLDLDIVENTNLDMGNSKDAKKAKKKKRKRCSSNEANLVEPLPAPVKKHRENLKIEGIESDDLKKIKNVKVGKKEMSGFIIQPLPDGKDLKMAGDNEALNKKHKKLKRKLEKTPEDVETKLKKKLIKKHVAANNEIVNVNATGDTQALAGKVKKIKKKKSIL